MNQAVRDIFETSELLENGRVDAKGRDIDGMDQAHLQTVLAVQMLQPGEADAFRNISYDAKGGQYIFVAADQLRASQIPGDAQVILALNERRRDLGIEHAEFTRDIPVMKTSGGVSRFEIFRKKGKAKIRMASATQGDVADFGKVMQGVGVYDVDILDEVGERAVGFDIQKWIANKKKGKNRRGQPNWEYARVQTLADKKRELKKHMLDFLNGKTGPKSPDSSLLVSFGRLDNDLRKYAREVLIEANHGDIIKDIDGRRGRASAPSHRPFVPGWY